MECKHIIFDWDGTLADTYPVISAAYNHTFDTLGLPRISYDEVKRITSTLQNKDTLGHIFGERKDEAKTAFYDYIQKHHTDKLQPMPHAKELLDFCAKNFECYLITNKKTQFVKEEIKKLGFENIFKKVIAAGELAEDKPHKMAAFAVFDNNPPSAAEIVMIGDGEADVKTAQNYDTDTTKTTSIILDVNHKYKGIEPTFMVADLLEIIPILKGEK